MSRYLLLTVATLGLTAVEAQAYHPSPDQLVQGWYARYLGRQADHAGLCNWVDQLRAGRSPEYLEAALIGSDEYWHRNGCSPTGFITALYVDVLGRNPCAAEVQQWCHELRKCGNRHTLAAKFLCTARNELAQRPPQQPEYRAPQYQPSQYQPPQYQVPPPPQQEYPITPVRLRYSR